MSDKVVITSVNDRVDLIGVMLGLMENGTGLTEDEIYSRILELQELEDGNER